MDLAARLAAIADTSFCERLVTDAQRDNGRPSEDIFWMGPVDQPAYGSGLENSLTSLAAEQGEHPAETFLRLSRESGGKALFTQRVFNKNMKALANLFS